jgi:hypothetical protein
MSASAINDRIQLGQLTVLPGSRKRPRDMPQDVDKVRTHHRSAKPRGQTLDVMFWSETGADLRLK